MEWDRRGRDRIVFGFMIHDKGFRVSYKFSCKLNGQSSQWFYRTNSDSKAQNISCPCNYLSSAFLQQSKKAFPPAFAIGLHVHIYTWLIECKICKLKVHGSNPSKVTICFSFCICFCYILETILLFSFNIWYIYQVIDFFSIRGVELSNDKYCTEHRTLPRPSVRVFSYSWAIYALCQVELIFARWFWRRR